MPSYKSAKPGNPIRRKPFSRTRRWLAVGALGASLFFGSPKARAQEIVPQQVAAASHLLRGSVSKELREIIPGRVQRELLKAKTLEQRVQLLNSGLTVIEKRRLFIALQSEFDRNPEIQRLVLKNWNSEQRVRKRTADAVLAAVLALALGGVAGYKAGKHWKPRSKEPVQVVFKGPVRVRLARRSRKQ